MATHNDSRTVLKLSVALLTLLLLSNAAIASHVSSGGFGESVDVQAEIGIVSATASSGPLPNVSATGVDSYGPVSDTVVSASALLNGHPLLSTGVLVAAASHQRNPRDVRGSSQVDDVNVDLEVTALVPLATLQADQVTSSSQITGHCGNLSYQAESVLTNASVEALNGLFIDLNAQPAPNTFVDLSVLGGELASVTLILNEQQVSGNGVDQLSVSVNAIHLSLNVNVLGLLTLDGDIIIGHSNASMDCATADIEMTKTADPSQGMVGQPLSYHLEAENLGPDAAAFLRISDSLDASAQFESFNASAGGDCAMTGPDLTCEWSQTGAGESRWVDIVVTPQSAGDLVNTGVAETDDYDPNGDNDTDTVVTPILPLNDDEADLNLTKVANPDPGTVGEPLVWTLTILNQGPDSAGPVQLVDSLPANISVTSVTSSTGSCNHAGASVTCDWQDLSAGQSHVVQIEAIPLADGDLVNSATVTGSTGDPDGDDNTSVVVTYIAPPANAMADLSVVASASNDSTTVGETLALGVSLLNAGPDNAVGVQLSAQVSAEVEIDSLAGGLATHCGHNGGQINCELSDLDSGNSPMLIINATAISEGALALSTSVNAQTADPDLSNNQDAISVAVAAAPEDGAADMIGTIELLPGSVVMGSPALVEVTASNAGPDPATGEVTLTYNADQDEEILSFSVSDNGVCASTLQMVSCSWNALAVDAERKIIVEVMTMDMGQLQNNAVARASAPMDPNMSNNADQITLVVMESPGEIAACTLEQVTDEPLGALSARLSSGGGAQLIGFSTPASGGSTAERITLMQRYGETKVSMLSHSVDGFSGNAQLLAGSRDLRHVLALVDGSVMQLDRQSGSQTDLGLNLIGVDSGNLVDMDSAGQRSVAYASNEGEDGLWLVESGNDSERIANAADTDAITSLAISGHGESIAMVSSGNPAGGQAQGQARLHLWHQGQWQSRQLDSLSEVQVLDLAAHGDVALLRAFDGQAWALYVSRTGAGLQLVPASQSEIPPSARLTANANALVMGLSQAEGGESLVRVNLASGESMVLYQGQSAQGSDFELLDSGSQGQVLSFVSRNQNLGDNTDGSREVFVLDCLKPRQGLWWNPERPGHGLFIGSGQDDALFLQWYTYDDQGNPTWYVALATRKAAVWNAPLFRVTRVDGQINTQAVGSAVLAFNDSEHALFHWTVNGHTRTEAFAYDEFGGYAPHSDRTGSWYRPEDNGWGVSVAESGSRQVALLFVYDAAGQPTWFIAGGSRGPGALPLSQLFGVDLCPTHCPVEARPASATTVGTITLAPVNTARELSLQYALDAANVTQPFSLQDEASFYSLNRLRR